MKTNQDPWVIMHPLEAMCLMDSLDFSKAEAPGLVTSDNCFLYEDRKHIFTLQSSFHHVYFTLYKIKKGKFVCLYDLNIDVNRKSGGGGADSKLRNKLMFRMYSYKNLSLTDVLKDLEELYVHLKLETL